MSETKSALQPARVDASPPAPSPRGKQLSGRLRQTLALLLEGKSNDEVCEALSTSRNTVHADLKALYRLYGVTTRCQLIVLIYRTALRSLIASKRIDA